MRTTAPEANALLRQLHALSGMRISATDGDVGHVHDVYVDDRDWRVRFVHVHTLPWLFDRHVLVAPTVVPSVDWDDRRMDVALTREQVRTSPELGAHTPVSGQHPVPLYEYFQFPLTSSPSFGAGEELAARLHTLLTEMHMQEPALREAVQDDGHLWSARALRHCGVESEAAELGRVDDFVFDPDAWRLRYLAIDNGGHLHGNRFLVPIDAVQCVSWDARRVRITLDGAARDSADRCRTIAH